MTDENVRFSDIVEAALKEYLEKKKMTDATLMDDGSFDKQTRQALA